MSSNEAPENFPVSKRIINRIGLPFGIVPFPRSFPPIPASTGGRAEMFEAIYQDNSWNSAESRSGPGSEVAYAASYLAALRTLLRERGLRRFLDIPCGDLNWARPLIDDPAINYVGGDVSETLVTHLRTRFPGVEMLHFDICETPFPKGDVWHCRDCLFHLPFRDIRRAFVNFARSDVPWALMTTHHARYLTNLDVEAGGFRFLDLARPPIGLPPADVYLRDYRPLRDFPRYVGLWPRQAIADVTARWH